MRARVGRYATRVRGAVRESFAAEYTPREIAGSFAVGVFITMLPTLGTGLLVFFVLAAVFEWVNKVALFASVVVVNPVVKWGVYAGSVTLGILLLGPVENAVFSPAAPTEAGRELLVRLLVGNLILAVLATVLGYVAVHRMVVAYRDREPEVVAEVVEDIERAVDPDDTV